MITVDQALAWLLDSACAACGSALPGPGEPCGECGAIPAVTAPEAAEHLDGPMALAAVEAARLRAEAWRAHDAAVALMADADRALHSARLRVRLDEAQRALDEHQRASKALIGPRAKARQAEGKAATDLAAAAGEHAGYARAEEVARRMRHGLKAETAAARDLAVATEVLSRYQGELAQAQARREAAEAAVEQSAARAGTLEKARDDAAAMCAGPGRIPASGERISMGLIRLVLSGQLDEVEMAVAGQLARMVCAITGATDDIIAEARRDWAREREAEATGKPMLLRPDGTGQVAAFPNPLSPATPTPGLPWAGAGGW